MRPTTEPVTKHNDLGLVTGRYCPKCSEKIELHHVDDIGTKWFFCPKCSEYFTKFKTEEQVRLEKAVNKLRDVHRSTTLSEIGEVLNTTIKQDQKNKVITFLTMLLTYTDSDQTNIGFTSESSTGKSYIPIELSWYFPKEDVLKFGYVSPTAFFHQAGNLLPDPQDPGDPDDSERKPRKIIWIDLEKKIMIFLDMPHDQLLQRLRPLLSHDEKVIIHEITDRSRKGGLITKKVWIQGYPSVIFCTTKFSLDDQERTRLLLLSPETTPEKIRQGILLKIQKDADKDAFQNYMESDPRRQWLKNRVEDVKHEDIKNVIIPEDLKQKIQDKFLNEHVNLIPRHQRDVGRLIAIIKAHALLNLWNRERIEDNIIADEIDVDEGFRIYEEISRSNELGLPPEVFNIYERFKEEFKTGLSHKELQAKYYIEFNRTLGSRRLNEIVNLLTSVGLLIEEPDPRDRRLKKLVAPSVTYSFEDQNVHETSQKLYVTPPATNTIFSLDQVKGILNLKVSYTGHCDYCGQGSLDMVNYPKPVISYAVETFGGKKFLVCEDCGQKIMRELQQKEIKS